MEIVISCLSHRLNLVDKAHKNTKDAIVFCGFNVYLCLNHFIHRCMMFFSICNPDSNDYRIYIIVRVCVCAGGLSERDLRAGWKLDQ